MTAATNQVTSCEGGIAPLHIEAHETIGGVTVEVRVAASLEACERALQDSAQPGECVGIPAEVLEAAHLRLRVEVLRSLHQTQLAALQSLVLAASEHLAAQADSLHRDLDRARLQAAPSVAPRTPASYQAATWYGTLPMDPQTGEQGVAFEGADGSIVRLRLSADSVRHVVASLASDYFSGAWPFGQLTDTQCLANAKFEAAQRAGTLRGLPSCFGSLS